MKKIIFIFSALLFLFTAQFAVSFESNLACNQLPAFTGYIVKAAGSCATVTPARSQRLPSNPTGTVSGVQVMTGLAGTFTPATSGNMFLTVQSTIANSTINDGCLVQMRFGTGGAPANGAAATGTAIGQQQAATSFAANALVPSTLIAYQTGLVVSTVYWFDLGFAAVTGGTCTPTAIVMDAFEQ